MAVHVDEIGKIFPTTRHSVGEERPCDPYQNQQAEREANAHSYSRRLPLALRKAKGIYVQGTNRCP